MLPVALRCGDAETLVDTEEDTDALDENDSCDEAHGVLEQLSVSLTNKLHTVVNIEARSSARHAPRAIGPMGRR